MIHKLFHICQITTVEDYVERFSELYDQLTAYEEAPDMLHYLTRFLDGLKPSIHISVSIQ
jgi:hypothetical protein